MSVEIIGPLVVEDFQKLGFGKTVEALLQLKIVLNKVWASAKGNSKQLVKLMPENL